MGTRKVLVDSSCVYQLSRRYINNMESMSDLFDRIGANKNSAVFIRKRTLDKMFASISRNSGASEDEVADDIVGTLSKYRLVISNAAPRNSILVV